MINPASARPFYRVEDLIERHDDVREFSEINLQREIQRSSSGPEPQLCASQATPNFVVRTERWSFECDNHRAISIAHARAARQQRVALAYIGVGVNRDCRDVKFTAHRALIQRLNVFEPMFESVPRRSTLFSAIA